jgi:ribonuclease HI
MSDDAPELDFVRLFSDGACSGNPGPGGWAYVLQHPATGRESEASGAERQTTNNRMELQAVIEGLSTLRRRCVVELVADSQYVGKGLTEWMPRWKANGWRRKVGKQFQPVINLDLWQRLDELIAAHQLRYTFVYGHAGHPENERCDRLAVAAYRELMAEGPTPPRRPSRGADPRR